MQKYREKEVEILSRPIDPQDDLLYKASWMSADRESTQRSVFACQQRTAEVIHKMGIARIAMTRCSRRLTNAKEALQRVDALISPWA